MSADDAKAAGKSFLQQAQARRAESDFGTYIDVPEFAAEGEEPVRIYGKVPTIADRADIERAALDPDTGRIIHAEAAIRTIIRLACDKNGEKLFDVGNAQFMRSQVPADVLESLAYRLNAGLSHEAAKKN
jgi:hypothetical protein